jgi:hypothetical protein
MIKFKVKNLGNIKFGYQENEGFMDITKVTLFTGEQDNEYLFRLISELRIYEHLCDIQFDDDYATKREFSLKKELDFKENTEMIAIGNKFIFEYKNQKFSITKKEVTSDFTADYYYEYIEKEKSPVQQVKGLYLHLADINRRNSHLVTTTYSPYILNALTLAIKAKGIENQNIVPKESCLNIEDVSIYELTENGVIRKVPVINGLLSDDNYLNNHLAKSNQLFDQLLELEALSS